MSVVYLAEDPHLGRKVALKLIAPDLAQDAKFRGRFVRESRLAASLEHPDIITVYEAKALDGLLYIAMRDVHSCPVLLRRVTVGENAVWIVGTDGEVARIDPATDRVVKLTGTENGATQVAAGLDAVWVLNPRFGTVTRIDPGMNAVVATIDVGKGATSIAVGEGSVWVTRATG
jgi:hypothetical protein